LQRGSWESTEAYSPEPHAVISIVLI